MPLQTQMLPEYLSQLPESLPDDGRVLVHNNIRPSRRLSNRPSRRLGLRGFRAWLTAPDERWVVCNCGWTTELGQHYEAVADRNRRAARQEVLLSVI